MRFFAILTLVLSASRSDYAWASENRTADIAIAHPTSATSIAGQQSVLVSSENAGRLKRRTNTVLLALGSGIPSSSVIDSSDTIAALQGTVEKGRIKIFIDCSPDCYTDYIKTELPNFDYVRDKEQANLHLLITSQRAANGGYEVTLALIGLGDFADLYDTQKFVTQATDTDELIQRALVRRLKFGLVRFVARTPSADMMEISFLMGETPPRQETDPWDHWLFNTDVSAEFRGEKSTHAVQFAGSLSANRITEAGKIKMGLSSGYAENVYSIPGVEYKSVARTEAASALLVGSIGKSWSIGGFLSASSSTYDNTRLWLNVAPAIEFDIFPYAESTRRQCRIQYRIGLHHFDYYSETIFYRMNETHLAHALLLALDVKEPWGTASVALEGSQFLHDRTKSRLKFSGSLVTRVFEGLSIRMSGIVSMIHDQLTLPRYDATPEEVLLQLRELATTYSYYTSVGVSYTFGSIFSNVVNPRFGE